MIQNLKDWLLRKNAMNSETNAPFLIAGLGNPGKQYRANRHNVGFMSVDRLAQTLQVNFARMENKALIAKAVYHEERLVLAKPQTFMNLSGQPVAALARFYKVPLERIMIVYDDVDLPLGVLRIRPTGGSAGQRGMASIIERLGSQAFPRLRVGIGRPPGRMDAAAYVLQDFSKSEQEFLNESLERAGSAILEWVTQGLESSMNKYNGSEQNGA
jgi:PTH1 family peptidyl-tRNA hydrolase